MTFLLNITLNPTHSSHTHLQATQTNPQPKLANKYACPTHNNGQKSTGGNSGLASVCLLTSILPPLRSGENQGRQTECQAANR